MNKIVIVHVDLKEQSSRTEKWALLVAIFDTG